MRAEPIVFLSFVQHDLQRAHAEGEQRDANVVDSRESILDAIGPRRVLDQSIDKQQRQNADGQVDEENPAPGVVIRDPSAKSRTDGGRDDYGDAVHSEGDAPLFWWKRIRQNGLRQRLESAAPCTLKDAEKN